MKLRLLDFLVCPDCESDFELTVLQQSGGEIHEGTLVCKKCVKSYPVHNSIPRILPPELREGKEETADAFGWEWKKFTSLHDLEQYKNQFLDWIDPVKADAFQGKVVLDAGCGMGRFMQVSASFGAKEVIGIDLSRAVDAAYENLRHLPNAHLIQTDIYHLPFRKPASFDLIYSIGVLHHLPDPEKGFHSLVRHLKRDGLICAWVYGYENNEWIVRWLNPIRKFLTSRMPRKLLYALSFLFTLVFHPVLKIFYGQGRGGRLPYSAYMKWLAQFGFRHTHHVVFDQLVAPTAFYLKEEEFKEWFKRSELSDVHLSWRNENSWRGHARSRN